MLKTGDLQVKLCIPEDILRRNRLGTIKLLKTDFICLLFTCLFIYSFIHLFTELAAN